MKNFKNVMILVIFSVLSAQNESFFLLLLHSKGALRLFTSDVFG